MIFSSKKTYHTEIDMKWVLIALGLFKPSLTQLSWILTFIPELLLYYEISDKIISTSYWPRLRPQV